MLEIEELRKLIDGKFPGDLIIDYRNDFVYIWTINKSISVAAIVGLARDLDIEISLFDVRWFKSGLMIEFLYDGK